jgi:hypothetical protein
MWVFTEMKLPTNEEKHATKNPCRRVSTVIINFVFARRLLSFVVISFNKVVRFGSVEINATHSLLRGGIVCFLFFFLTHKKMEL